MDRIGGAFARRIDHARDVEVRLARIARAERDRIIEIASNVADVVRLRVSEHRLDARLAARARNAHRDFAAIGDEEFADHLVLPSANFLRPHRPWQRDAATPAGETPAFRRAPVGAAAKRSAGVPAGWPGGVPRLHSLEVTILLMINASGVRSASRLRTSVRHTERRRAA